jgi:hypothetical protein
MEVISEIDINRIKNKLQIYTCNVFKIFEAEYQEDDNSTNMIPIYGVKLKFLDNDAKIENIVKNIENNNDKISKLSHNGLDRLGYYYNHESNDLHLFYMKHKYKIFEINIFLESLWNKQYKLNKLHLFNDLVKSVLECHENHTKVSLIHPNLIFYNKDVKFCDILFDEIIETVDKIKYFNISKYFGFFDLDLIDQIKNNLMSDEELELLYLKTDVIQLCLILAMLFTTVTTNRREKYVGTTFDEMLVELQNDFFTQAKEFKFINNIGDYEIKKFLKDNFTFNFTELPSIHQFAHKFKNIYNKELSNIPCSDCKNVGTKHKKNVIYTCHEVVCDQCLPNHKCSENVANKRNEKYETLVSQTNRLKEVAEKLPQTEKKHISKYFETCLNDVFWNIDDEQNKIQKLIKLQEDRINGITSYINILLNEKNEETSNGLIRRIEDYNTYLEKNQKMIDLRLRGMSPLRKKLTGIKRRITDLNLESVNLELNRDRESQILQEDIINIDTDDHIETGIKNYEEFVRQNERFKESIGNNFKVMNTLSLLEKQASTYIKEIESCFSEKFLNDLAIYKDNIISLIQENYKLKSNRISENTKAKNRNEVDLIGFIDIKQTAFKAYNVSTKEIMENRTVTFYDKKIVYPFENSRWINIGSKLFVTGGIGIKNNKIIPTSVSYILDMNEPDKELQVETLKNMIYSRDQHMMVKIDELTVIVIGGYETNTCEVFNVLADHWEELPKLNRFRYNATTYVSNKNDIYVCFGFEGRKDGLRDINSNQIVPLSNIERFNFPNGHSWEILDIDTTAHIAMAGVIPENNDKIYIFGGKSIDGTDVDNVYSFDLINSTITLVPKKCKRASFFESEFFQIDKKSWGNFNTELEMMIIKDFNF